MRRNHLPTVTMPSLRTNRRTDPANSGLFVLFQEISGSIRLRGGPGRTRTSNQTVMRQPALTIAAGFVGRKAHVKNDRAALLFALDLFREQSVCVGMT